MNGELGTAAAEITRSEAIRGLFQSGQKASLQVTGGGASLVGELLRVPGASAYVHSAHVPYATAAVDRVLGRPPERYCDRETALQLAAVAFRDACREASRTNAVGFGMTAALASDRERRGPHRVFAAVQSSHATRLTSVTLSKGARTRAAEDAVAADIGLRLLCLAAGVPSPAVALTQGESLEDDAATASDGVRDVRGRVCPYVVLATESGERLRDSAVAPAVLSGSFNPPHPGHEGLRTAARDWLGCEVDYEISIANADKPPLDDLRLRDRLSAVQAERVVVLGLDTFAKKSAALPGRVFVVGVDTAARVLNPDYYSEGLAAALARVRENGCRFLVAARLFEGRVQTLQDLNVPEEFAGIFEALPADRFRSDISSTELRRQRHAN